MRDGPRQRNVPDTERNVADGRRKRHVPDTALIRHVGDSVGEGTSAAAKGAHRRRTPPSFSPNGRLYRGQPIGVQLPNGEVEPISGERALFLATVDSDDPARPTRLLDSAPLTGLEIVEL
jgi:hypothetical protein